MALKRTGRLGWIVAAIAVLAATALFVRKKSDDEAQFVAKALREFVDQNPTTALHKLVSGEGDSEHVYMHFIYSEPKSSEKKETVWLYRKQKNGIWTAVQKSNPKTAGKTSGS